jgi:hypothetical protein
MEDQYKTHARLGCVPPKKISSENVILFEKIKFMLNILHTTVLRQKI